MSALAEADLVHELAAEDEMKIDGHCHCGYITFEAEIEPDKTLICNCTDCQTFSGCAFRVHAFTREDAFRVAVGRTENLRQDRRKRQQKTTGVLSGMWNAH